METTQFAELGNLHLQAWNERDTEKRNLIFKKIYASNIRFLDPTFEMTGFDPLNKFISDLLEKNPEFNFSLVRPADINHSLGRVYWQFGTTAKPNIVTGLDVFEIDNDLVEKLFVFVDVNAA